MANYGKDADISFKQSVRRRWAGIPGRKSHGVVMVVVVVVVVKRRPPLVIVGVGVNQRWNGLRVEEGRKPGSTMAKGMHR